ncbi:MAG: ankyrin repeat domain-containing protein [Xylophilus ampelinus]
MRSLTPNPARHPEICRRRLLTMSAWAAGALMAGGCAAASAAAPGWKDFLAAIKRDDPDLAATLINRGFDQNAMSPDGQVALVSAIREPSPKVVRILLSTRRTQVEVKNKAGETPLMMAAIRCDLELTRQLIARDAAVNKTGWTPLHYAVSGATVTPKQQTDMVGLLLEHYAFIDAESPNGTTPLMMASFYGREESAFLLLQEGADTAMRNQQGLTALDFARKANRQELAAAIERKMAERKPSPPAR